MLRKKSPKEYVMALFEAIDGVILCLHRKKACAAHNPHANILNLAGRGSAKFFRSCR